jgi:hypothetical protein
MRIALALSGGELRFALEFYLVSEHIDDLIRKNPHVPLETNFGIVRPLAPAIVGVDLHLAVAHGFPDSLLNLIVVEAKAQCHVAHRSPLRRKKALGFGLRYGRT